MYPKTQPGGNYFITYIFYIFKVEEDVHLEVKYIIYKPFLDDWGLPQYQYECHLECISIANNCAWTTDG